MTVHIDTLEGAVETFVEPEPLLFGVRFVTDTVGGVVAEGTDVSISTEGSFSLGDGGASFRARFSVKVDVFKELWADVAFSFTAPDQYSISREAFLAFANGVVAPQLRNHAQRLWDPLLVEAGYPARILPQISGVFVGSQLPDTLGPAGMEELRKKESLTVSDVEGIPLDS